MKKNVFKVVLPVVLLFYLLFTSITYAAGIDNSTNIQNQPSTANSSTVEKTNQYSVNNIGCCDTDPRVITLNIVKIILGIFLLLIFFTFIYAGYKLISSHKNKEQIKTAKRLILYAIIGLIIVLFAYEILVFVLNGFDAITPYKK